MRKRYFGLAVAMVMSMTMLVLVGSVETRDVLEPLNLADGMDPVKVPFLLTVDEGFKSMVEIAKELKEQASAAAPEVETPDVAQPGADIQPEPGEPGDGGDGGVPAAGLAGDEGDTGDDVNGGGEDARTDGQETSDPPSKTPPQEENPVTPSDPGPDSDTDTKPDSGPNMDTAPDTDAALNPNPDPEPNPNPGTQTDPGADTDPGAASGSGGGETLSPAGGGSDTQDPSAGDVKGEPGDGKGDGETEAVDDSWFDDVLFIGDSRTVGLREYCRSGNADYFCSVGMSVFNYSGKTESDKSFTSTTLIDLLGSRTYGKIFISLGINECGYPMESLMSAYNKLVDKVRELQPDAIIILQGIMAVSRGYASNASYFSPQHLADINSRIEAIADGSTIFYIDVNSAFADEEGYLPSNMSSDGCHLYISYYRQWADWIKTAVADIPV